MRILLSHSGKQHSYHVAKALDNKEALSRFYTSSYITSPYLQQVLTNRGDTYWTRRFINGLNGSKVNAAWRFEIPEIILGKIYGNGAKVQSAVYNRDASFDAHVSKKLTNEDFDVFWGFQGSCLKSLRVATELGKKAVCELATGHVLAAKTILTEEQKLHPKWADSFDNLEFPASYQKRLEAEPHQASQVVVASQFTQQTLIDSGIPQSKIHMLPLGVDIDHITYQPEKYTPFRSRPLRLLYAGRVTQRKGIAYLLEAMKSFPDASQVQLDIIGHIHGAGKGLDPYKGLFQLKPGVAQSELFELYQHYDALVLPTLFEGFGLVIIEAMAAGLPVITTDHSIGPELIKNDENGYIVPIRDVTAIVKAIESLASKTEGEMYQMRKNAREKSEEYTWQAYEPRLHKVLSNIVDGSK